MTIPHKNFVEELRWRGMLHDLMPGTEEQLTKEVTTGYIGFDPTSDSLGVGNLVQIMTLLHFQRCGHKPMALIGGATGMIGDPSFKNQERQLLSMEILQHNIACQKAQLMRFLDFKSGPNAAELVNNYDWFGPMGFLDFIRDVGKHISINYMMAKDSVKSRLETGLSFTEFSYQLIQGYDFYHLYFAKGCKLQMGGSDQWGNIVTGTELLRRKAQVSDAYALTTPLIKKADGTKFGKTESGNVWLDARKTSPYQFYQFWLNASDADAGPYLRIFTTWDREKIESLEQAHQQAPHMRLLQKALAEDITLRVHGHEAFELAQEATQILFGKGTTESLAALDEEVLLQVFEGVPGFTVPASLFQAEVPVVDLLADFTRVFESKGECRKMIAGGGLSINKVKVESPTESIGNAALLKSKYLVVQKGKKNYYLIKVE